MHKNLIKLSNLSKIPKFMKITKVWVNGLQSWYATLHWISHKILQQVNQKKKQKLIKLNNKNNEYKKN